MRLASIVASALLASSVATAAPCMPTRLESKVLTPANAAIAPGGGIIVIASSAPAYGGGPSGVDAAEHADVASHADWRVRAGAHLIAPGIKVIAPGLAVYDVGEATGELVLEDADHKELLHAHRGERTAELAPPKLTRVSVNDPRHMMRHPYTAMTAVVADKPPAGAVALVVFDQDGKPRSWGTPSVTSEVYVYSSGGCGTAIGIPSSAGDSVRLAWLDGSGRLSRLSAAIKVTTR
jgi:hypothetical protein